MFQCANQMDEAILSCYGSLLLLLRSGSARGLVAFVGGIVDEP